jgi:hypothetical protein
MVNPEIIKQIAACAEKGWTSSATAKLLGMTKNQVIGYAYRNKIKWARVPVIRTGDAKAREIAKLKARLARLVNTPKPQPRQYPIAAIEFVNSEAVGRVTLADLRLDQCRTVVDTPGGVLYCGLPRQPGSAYCPDCHRRHHAPSSSRSRPANRLGKRADIRPTDNGFGYITIARR